MQPKDYDSTVARIAGNILSGHATVWNCTPEELAHMAKGAVMLARAIVEETKRSAAPAPRET